MVLIDNLFQSQLREWELAKQNYKALQKVLLRKIQIEKATVYLQFNPGRIISSSAKVDKKSLEKRPCFLCKKNLPAEQEGISLSDNFMLLVNPFPILQKHFTIVNKLHTPQRLLPYLEDLLKISRQLGKEYTVFYNGAKCGASAPDHMHFQAGVSMQFPIWEIYKSLKMETIYSKKDVTVKAFESYVRGLLVEAEEIELLTEIIPEITRLLHILQPQEDEPMLNLLVKYAAGWKVILFPREKHRPSQYFEKGNAQLLLSPASVDFGGLLAVPRKEDYNRLDKILLKDIFEQLSLNKTNFLLLKEKISKL